MAATLIGTTLVAGSAATASTTAGGNGHEFVVLYAEGASLDAAHAAITAAGGSIIAENSSIGAATVSAADPAFADSLASNAAIQGTARNRIIGDVPDNRDASGRAEKADAAVSDLREGTVKAGTRKPGKNNREEPLANLQWDMRQIGATTDGSYRVERGKRSVLVGVLDTGVDGTHPDIAPNFDRHLSRNFTTDIPVDANGDSIDGPCEEEPDLSCEDPADVDEDGHGTHVASTIASPINGIGIAGVAPNVSIVNLRAGQDSGYFFLQPSLDALTYAGDNGVDVINMSYYIDPWLFNCASNPADSPADQQEQRTIVAAMQRALDYARDRSVTLVSAAGNGASDYTKPLTDSSSPDFADVAGEVAYTRDLLDPADCVSMPSEGDGVISVSSTGPSERKSYFSDYGNGYVDVAAPGGDSYDTPTGDRDLAGAVLAAYPESLAIANEQLDESGEPTDPSVIKSCDAKGKACGYYQYLQGTSMAAPHAAGVAALIVSRFGKSDRGRAGKTLPPYAVEERLFASATETRCPTPADFTYTRRVPQSDGSYRTVVTTHTCEGTPAQNGFFGAGIVDALAAVRR